ncbi:ImmA/IrrE family metallo-endopeptidase [Bacillus tianshenii]|nr:ImmA/IrrE family metallo-endopeptidase [Bacillus tianshenii]
MHLRNIMLNESQDHYESHANRIIKRFNFKYPDEIDMYQICFKFGIKIKPLAAPFYPFEIEEGTESYASPFPNSNRGHIFLKPNLDPIRKKLLLAEEFCHIQLHYHNQLTVSSLEINKYEKQARRMAAYLLMPKNFLENIYVTAIDQSVLVSDIADHFLVTEEFAHYRLKLEFGYKVEGFSTIRKQIHSLEWLE